MQRLLSLCSMDALAPPTRAVLPQANTPDQRRDALRRAGDSFP